MKKISSIQTAFRRLALAFPETTEAPHFEKTSFRVKKKIFASLDEKSSLACLRLSAADQDVFSALGKDAVFPIPNAWGRQGWTHFRIDQLEEEFLTDALTAAYCVVAPKKLADLVRPLNDE